MKNSIHQQEPGWYLFSAEGKVLGRLATRVANLLRGKNKPIFVPYLDCGDHVVIINANKVVLTGNKMRQKEYYHYSGFIGGLKTKSVADLMQEKPEQVIIRAVKGMLPKTKLQSGWLKRLHVYTGEDHPHKANISTPSPK